MREGKAKSCHGPVCTARAALAQPGAGRFNGGLTAHTAPPRRLRSASDVVTRSFIGRRNELAAIEDALRAARLVTLTGPAGVGKTRLAREISAARQSRGEPVWFCELAVASNAEDACRALGAALDLPLVTRGSSVIAQLGASIAARGPSLLVLDNFEHLTPLAGEMLGAWLRAAPDARFLVTSQERLRLEDEVVLPLAPLRTPPDGDEAVELFLTRVRSGGRAALVEADLPLVQEIVGVLDGLPLAIELAAARVGVVPLATLVELLPAQLRVLAHGRRDAPTRHRTLHAALAWSWALLSPSERAAAARCATLRGSFTFDAASEVMALEGGAEAALDALQALHDKSWLHADGSGARARSRMLSTVAAFALDQLDPSSLREARARYSAYAARLAGAWMATSSARGAAGPTEQVVAEVGAELDGLLGVVDGPSEDAAALETHAAILVAAGYALSVRGPFAAHLARLDRVISDPHFERADAALRAETLITRARTHRVQGDLPAASEDARSAVAIAGELDPSASPEARGSIVARAHSIAGLCSMDRGHYAEARDAYAHAMAAPIADPASLGALFIELGDVERLSGDTARSRAHAERALQLLRAADDARGVGRALNLRAIALTNAAAYDEAQAAYEEAIAIFARLRDARMEAIAQGNLAMLLQERGRLDEATPRYAAACAMLGLLGDLSARASYLALSGTAHHEAGRVRDAIGPYEEAVSIFRRLGQHRMLAVGLAHLGAARAGTGDRDGAEAAFEEADRLVEVVADRFARATVEVFRAHLDLALGRDGSVSERRAVGLSMAQESQLVRRALRLLERVSPTPLDPDALWVGGAGWYQPPRGERVDLSRRPTLWQLFIALVVRREEAPGESISSQEASAAGWPGERIVEHAARTRVRVALAALRKMGLARAIVSTRAGWMIDPTIRVIRVNEG
jgi:predicted ATPase